MRLLLASPLLCLLVIGGVAIAIFQATRECSANDAWSYGLVIRKYWFPAICVLILAIALLFGVPLLVCASGLDITGPSWKYWLQTLAGNWSPDSFPPFSPRWRNSARSSVVVFRKVPFCILRDVSDPIKQCGHHISYKHCLEAAR